MDAEFIHPVLRWRNTKASPSPKLKNSTNLGTHLKESNEIPAGLDLNRQQNLTVQFVSKGLLYRINLAKESGLFQEDMSIDLWNENDAQSQIPMDDKCLGTFGANSYEVADVKLLLKQIKNFTKENFHDIIDENLSEVAFTTLQNVTVRLTVSALENSSEAHVSGAIIDENGKSILFGAPDTLFNLEKHQSLKKIIIETSLLGQTNTIMYSDQFMKNFDKFSFKCGTLNFAPDSSNSITTPFVKQVNFDAVIEKSTISFIDKRVSFMNPFNKKHHPSSITEGCPKTRKLLHVSIVVDCLYYKAFRGNVNAIKSEIKSVWNVVNGIYTDTFNISLKLISIIIFSSCTPGKSDAIFNKHCSGDYVLTDRLSDFSGWKSDKFRKSGLRILLTDCASGGNVGVAWLGQLCVKDHKVNSSKNSLGKVNFGAAVAVSLVRNQHTVLAHEIAHSFGIGHDCDEAMCKAATRSGVLECYQCEKSCDCKNNFIMSPQSGGLNIRTFSPNSIRDLCLKSQNHSCLVDYNSNHGFPSVCGNGIREEGEDCDCGDEESCKNDPCCTPQCTFKPGAVCSDKDDECCNKCQIVSASQNKICIKGAGPCQKNSVCDGKSAKCPDLKTIRDGTACFSQMSQKSDPFQSSCASGFCTSRDIQCRTIGKFQNIIGSAVGNDSLECKMLCKSNDGAIIKYESAFIDGTICGRSGRCKKGACMSPSPLIWMLENWSLMIFVLFFFCSISYTLFSYSSKRIKKIRHVQQANPAIVSSHPTTIT